VAATEPACGPPPPTDCGTCPAGKTCCPSSYQPDRPHCVDLQLNKEHCGSCGKYCDLACLDGQCVDAGPCDDGGTCPSPLECVLGPPLTCCPPGTNYVDRISTYRGCCPEGDFCGCSSEFGAYCPISRRAAKTDIRYLTPADLEAARSRLLSTTPGRKHSDLYGHTSMAVAALQAQQRELEELRRQVEQLRQLARPVRPHRGWQAAEPPLARVPSGR
jgi:hypothetical protein